MKIFARLVIGFFVYHLLATGTVSFLVWENHIGFDFGEWDEALRFAYFFFSILFVPLIAAFDVVLEALRD